MKKLRAEVIDFAKKHGFTFKAWALAFFIFPPGAVLLPFKIPGLAMPMRFALSGFTLLVHTALTLGGSALIIAGVVKLWGHFIT